METFITIFLVTNMGILPGPIPSLGETCEQAGQIALSDTVVNDYGCNRATFVHPMSPPNRNPKRSPFEVTYCDRQDGYHKQQPCLRGEKQ